MGQTEERRNTDFLSLLYLNTWAVGSSIISAAAQSCTERVQKWEKRPIILVFVAISQKSISISDLDQILANSPLSTQADAAAG